MVRRCFGGFLESQPCQGRGEPALLGVRARQAAVGRQPTGQFKKVFLRAAVLCPPEFGTLRRPE
jgi:hypothetical protein